MKNIPVMQPYITDEEYQNIKETLESGWVAQGPKVKMFEEMLSKHEGSSHGIATTSCTTALHLALVAMGICSGHDVILPSFTFVATANVVEYTGATPVFTDIDISTFNISIERLEKTLDEQYLWDSNKKVMINKKTGNLLKAIIPVHEFGLCADIVKINKIAKIYNIDVLEDAACAVGSSVEGVHPGGFGNPCCLSFHPRKTITTGEGGMVLTSHDLLAEKLRLLRSHGASISELQRHSQKGYLLPDYNELGFNYRMTDIQAAMGIEQVKKIDYIISERRKKAQFYNELLAGFNYLITPIEPVGYKHTYQSYVCMLNSKALELDNIIEANNFRNELMEYLESVGIATRQGTHAVHTLGYYRNKYLLKDEDFPYANLADKLSITLPLYVNISKDDQQYVIENIKEFISKRM